MMKEKGEGEEKRETMKWEILFLFCFSCTLSSLNLFSLLRIDNHALAVAPPKRKH